MKHLIFIIVLLFPLIGNGQTFDYSASVETGYYTGVHYLLGRNIVTDNGAVELRIPIGMQIEHPSPSFYSDIQIGLHGFDHRLNFETNVITTFTDNSHFLNFTPLLGIYKTDLNYDPKNLPLKVGWKHSCSHTIERERLGLRYNAAYNKFYIKLKIK